MAAENEKKNKESGGENISYRVLLEPWVTEASTAAMEMNKYVFKISPESTKQQIRRAVEGLYKVHVVSVRTVTLPRKKRNYGRTSGWKSGTKKAIVTVKKGEKIGLFEGV